MTVRERVLRHTLGVIERVYRSGGTGHITLPDPATGEPITMMLNQRAAEEIVAWVADMLIADIRRRKDRGGLLSPTEEEALRLWREKVPHGYTWGASASGISFLLPLNADEEPIGPWRDREVVLAAHPTEYDLGWRVPKNKRAPGFSGAIRLDGSHRLERRNYVGYLRFPTGANRLAAWTRFDHLNRERAAQRLSPEDRRRYLLPYGARRLADGQETIFNRDHQQLGTRRGPAGRPGEHWFYYDGHSEDEKRRRAEEALRCFRAGEPLPGDWRGLSRHP